MLVYEPLPASYMITEGRWSPTTIIEPLEAMTGRTRHSRATDVIPGSEVTIEFREEGVSGSAVYNKYSALINIVSAEITIGVATVTRTWCDDLEGLMIQDR